MSDFSVKLSVIFTGTEMYFMYLKNIPCTSPTYTYMYLILIVWIFLLMQSYGILSGIQFIYDTFLTPHLILLALPPLLSSADS